MMRLWEGRGSIACCFSARSDVKSTDREETEYGDQFDEEDFDFSRGNGRGQKRVLALPRATSSLGRPAELRELPSTEQHRVHSRDWTEDQESLTVAALTHRHDEKTPSYDPDQMPYEGGMVSLDESPLRLQEIFQCKKLWQASMMHPGRVFDDLLVHMKPLGLWHFLHANLVGGHAITAIRSNRRRKLKLEEELREIRNAVISGRFMWRGKTGIFIQGEMRKGVEPRIFRSDVKDMEELVDRQKRKTRPQPMDEERRMRLESFFQDKLVSEVLRVVLEPVYEPTFSESSHGFRPGRTQHTALKYVRREFGEMNWIYSSDLRGVFEAILDDREVFLAQLRALIEKRVKDTAFLDLLFGGLKSRVILSDYEVNPPEEGYSPLSSKTGLVSLLCNIYFHPLDEWIDQKRKELQRDEQQSIDANRAACVLRDMDTRQSTKRPSAASVNPVFRRLCFCRFADDFLFGVAGPRGMAYKLREEFRAFAQEHLGFPLPNVKLKNASSRSPFLGHLVYKKVIVVQKQSTHRAKLEGGYRPHPREVDAAHLAPSSTAGVLIPKEPFVRGQQEVLAIEGETEKMIRLLARAGYCLKNGFPQPNMKHMHFPQSDTNTILRRMLLSICDFYRVARNRQRVVQCCSYILRHSTAKLYARKFKLPSRAAVFRRGGIHLTGRIKKTKGYYGRIDPLEGKYATGNYPKLPYVTFKEIPKPDLRPLPSKWQPEMMHIVSEKLMGTIPRF